MNTDSQSVVFDEVATQIKHVEINDRIDINSTSTQNNNNFGRNQTETSMSDITANAVRNVEQKQLTDWIKTGPTNLRVLGFFAGATLFAAGAIEFWIFLADAKIHAALVNAYCIVFGIVIMVLEVRTVLFAKQQKLLLEEMGFLSNVYLRALFYIFCGTLTCGEWSWSAILDD
eukprot:UN28846